MDAYKSVPPDGTYEETRKSLKRQLVRSLRNDREQWQIGEYREMKRAAATGNSCNNYRLINTAGPRKPLDSE